LVNIFVIVNILCYNAEVLIVEKKMSYLTFSVSSGCITAGFAYLLQASKVVHLTHPLQGGIYGVVAAVAISILNEIIDRDEEGQKYFAAGLTSVVATGVSCAAGYPMTFTVTFLPAGANILLAGLTLLPAVAVANKVALKFQEWCES
jgi:hypothetical protein